MFYSKRKKVNKWEYFGILWIIIVGLLLHFTYKWSNNSMIVGIFSPVNESVWEHLKLGYWSLILFSILEYPFINRYIDSFFLGKALGIITLEAVIIIIFYSYTAIIKKNILWVDVSAYFVGTILCQLVSKSIIKKRVSKVAEIIGLILLILIGFVLIYFTFYPPKLPIFMDPITKTYGIYKLK
ncbi:DUF6512 family protein [Anaerosalibacter sp. Marseille-P3206]|uniref:DUF6512 family protein n=1 Tax=Anaerosalibacter sp. Marseille-P3206 TaxID=1871005 RepID=UPI0009853D5A|nr:DUF6512 family protein [Anaerosalibacter sp. Marseille-P3206]